MEQKVINQVPNGSQVSIKDWLDNQYKKIQENYNNQQYKQCLIIIQHIQTKFDEKPHRVHFFKANALRKLQRYLQAIQQYKQASRKQPKQYSYYANCALAYGALNDKQNQKQQYQKSIKLEPKYSQPYFNYANFLFQSQNFKEAAIMYEKGIKKQQQLQQDTYNQAIIENYITSLYKTQRYKQAINLLTGCISLKPKVINYYTLLSERAIIYQKTGQSDLSIKDYRQLQEFISLKPQKNLQENNLIRQAKEKQKIKDKLQRLKQLYRSKDIKQAHVICPQGTNLYSKSITFQLQTSEIIIQQFPKKSNQQSAQFEQVKQKEQNKQNKQDNKQEQVQKQSQVKQKQQIKQKQQDNKKEQTEQEPQQQNKVFMNVGQIDSSHFQLLRTNSTQNQKAISQKIQYKAKVQARLQEYDDNKNKKLYILSCHKMLNTYLQVLLLSKRNQITFSDHYSINKVQYILDTFGNLDMISALKKYKKEIKEIIQNQAILPLTVKPENYKKKIKILIRNLDVSGQELCEIILNNIAFRSLIHKEKFKQPDKRIERVNKPLGIYFLKLITQGSLERTTESVILIQKQIVELAAKDFCLILRQIEILEDELLINVKKIIPLQ